MKLKNKVAIVTGAGQGIGRAVALRLASEGAAVAVVEINTETASSTANEIESLGGRALAVACDVSQRKEVDTAVEAIVDAFGTVDILVNNAQAALYGVPFEKITDEQMDRVMNSGFRGTFYLMQACFIYMKEQGGKIINVGSEEGLEGGIGYAAYAAAKEAIRALTRVAAHEWGKHRINVNAFCPAAMTPAVIEWSTACPEEYQANVSQIPLGRLGDPEKDIAPVIAFLAGPDSDFVTGMTIMVDGGKYVLR